MSPAAVFAHLVILLTLSAPPPAAQRPADRFGEIFQRGVAKQKTLQSMHASFVETTTSSLLVKPIVGKGTMVAVPPSRVRMTYAEPEAKTLVMDGKTLTIVWPRRSEREQIDIRETQKRIDRYFTNASLDDLRK